MLYSPVSNRAGCYGQTDAQALSLLRPDLSYMGQHLGRNPFACARCTTVARSRNSILSRGNHPANSRNHASQSISHEPTGMAGARHSRDHNDGAALWTAVLGRVPH